MTSAVVHTYGHLPPHCFSRSTHSRLLQSINLRTPESPLAPRLTQFELLLTSFRILKMCSSRVQEDNGGLGLGLRGSYKLKWSIFQHKHPVSRQNTTRSNHQLQCHTCLSFLKSVLRPISYACSMFGMSPFTSFISVSLNMVLTTRLKAQNNGCAGSSPSKTCHVNLDITSLIFRLYSGELVSLSFTQAVT